ncbi:MAG: hypothetical protein M3299_00675 [Thermoproteota archaeon]|nr:hypothetical protein [Thermoproteota archaeon]
MEALKKFDSIIEIDQVYGSRCDILVKIKCNILRELNSTIWQIKRIKRIRFKQILLVGGFA